MDSTDIQGLIATVDEIVLFHTGEHLNDLQQAILEGVFAHDKYADIARNSHRSEKHIKDVAGKLWRILSAALGEEISKKNICSSLQRHYYRHHFFDDVDAVFLSKDDPKNTKFDLNLKLEVVKELAQEGLTMEQIARALKVPLELVQQQIES